MGVRKTVIWQAVLASALALAACGAGNGSTPSTPSSTALAITLPNGSPPPSPMVLSDQQFISPGSNSAYLTTASRDASAVWSVSGNSIALANTPPGELALPGDPLPTASPGTTYIAATQTYGPSTLTVRDGGASASITVYHFASITFACQFRYQPAFIFDPDRASAGDLQHPDTYDLYVTETSSVPNAMDPCYGTALVTGSPPAWHMPSGGVVIPIASTADFMAITPAQFANPVTSAPVVQKSVALLFRTREGRYVKLEPGLGLLEVSDANGTFPF
ncbi:MAG TPA: hypothetical protein VFN49_00050 [Candidatus Aquilonibacter sp.]|nr:hypothetical protein [Candidatus Aquilonibacter sp.]